MTVARIEGMIQEAARTNSQVNAHVDEMISDYVSPKSVEDVDVLRDHISRLLPADLRGLGADLLQPLQPARDMREVCDVEDALNRIDRYEPASLYIYPTGTDLIGPDQFERYVVPLDFIERGRGYHNVFYTAFRDRRAFENAWEFGRVIWYGLRQETPDESHRPQTVCVPMCLIARSSCPMSRSRMATGVFFVEMATRMTRDIAAWSGAGHVIKSGQAIVEVLDLAINDEAERPEVRES